MQGGTLLLHILASYAVNTSRRGRVCEGVQGVRKGRKNRFEPPKKTTRMTQESDQTVSQGTGAGVFPEEISVYQTQLHPQTQ